MILPDDVIAAEKPYLKQMVEAFEQTGGNIVAAMQVPHDQISLWHFGCRPGQLPFERRKSHGGKPPASTAPSNLAVIGRYILDPNILRNLSRTRTGTGAEVQLTDAVPDKIAVSDNVYSYNFSRQRFDCGTKSGFLQAAVAFALARDDLKMDFYSYLQNIITTRTAAE